MCPHPGPLWAGPFRAGEESCVGERVMKKLCHSRTTKIIQVARFRRCCRASERRLQGFATMKTQSSAKLSSCFIVKSARTTAVILAYAPPKGGPLWACRSRQAAIHLHDINTLIFYKNI